MRNPVCRQGWEVKVMGKESMGESITEKFNQFIKAVDDKIIEFINSNKSLTKHISSIQLELWKNYKEINGTSHGFHGISEYIVFSTFKKFIELQNSQERFEPININRDLRFFELKNNNKVLKIYRASSLKHFPPKARKQLFKGGAKFRAPDIAILKQLKQEDDKFKLLAIIEIKNYLDKGSANSAIDMLLQIQEGCKDSHTKYALFSFGKISVKDEKRRLKTFLENNNNFLITNEEGNEEANSDFLIPRNKKSIELKVIDLAEFLTLIKEELTL